MNKRDQKILMDELRAGKTYDGVDTEVLYGCGLPEYEGNKGIAKEVLVNFLNWQCRYLNGGLDYEEMENCFAIFKHKRIIMI